MKKEFNTLLLETWKNITRPNREKIINEIQSVCFSTFGIDYTDIPKWTKYYIDDPTTLTTEEFNEFALKGTVEQLFDFIKNIQYMKIWLKN